MKLKLNKKGEISIVLVILVLISLMFTTNYYKTMKMSYALDEIQSIYDIVGIATLERIFDYEILKDEIYGLGLDNRMDYTGSNRVLDDYSHQIKSVYKNMISFEGDLVSSHKIIHQDVYFENTKWGTGYGEQFSPQVVIETIARLKLNIDTEQDNGKSIYRNFHSSKTNNNLQVLSVNSTSDGQTELVIRSTVRNIYE